MSDSDILAVQLWLGAGAIAFLAIAMSAAGWKHRVFISAMFIVAGIFVIAAFFARQMLGLMPKWEGAASQIANNPLAWFAMSLAGYAGVYIVNKLRGTKFNPNSKLNRVFQRQYKNQTVDLDGNDFVECTFENVTFIYEGSAPFLLTNSHFANGTTIAFVCPDPAINLAVGLQVRLQMMQKEVGFKIIPKDQFDEHFRRR